MNKLKVIYGTLMFAGMMCIGVTTYATTITPQWGTTSNKTNEVKDVQKTEDYYVRITQPSLKDETVQTFDTQMNIMGEATVGTDIKITVYYIKDEKDPMNETTEKEEYILKTVGATKTFSQLIDLKEGLNKVLIQYQYVNNGVKGSLSIKINRKPEAEKEMIKSYIKPQEIVEKIIPPTPEEKSNVLQTNTPTKK